MSAVPYEELIADEKAFLSLREECERIFDSAQCLPQQVFRIAFNHYYAFDHYYILSKEFPPFLERLSDFFSDVTVNYLNLEPEPMDYFKLSGFYGLASFEKTKLSEQYLRVMIGERGARPYSFAVNGDRGVMWGSSLQWGVHCDRISWELCVMGASRQVDKSIMGMLKCMDSAEVASYIEHLYRLKPSGAVNFLKKFPANYPNLDGPYGPR